MMPASAHLMITLGTLTDDKRSKLARDPTTASEVLVALTNDEEWEVRYYLAFNPATPIEVMIELAGDDDDQISWIASSNPALPPDTLIALAGHENVGTRLTVARNRSAPPKALAMLACDEEKHVRRGVASNPTTPPTVLETLARDTEEEVRAGVACNPMTQPALLARVLSLARHYEVRILAAAASNPVLPVEQMAELACDEDIHVLSALIKNRTLTSMVRGKLPCCDQESLSHFEDKSVRKALITHPALPPQLLLVLALIDKDPEVRETAMSFAKTKPNSFWETTVSPSHMRWPVSSSESGAMRKLDEALLAETFLLTQSVAQSLAVARKVIESVYHLLKSNSHQDSNSLE